MTAAQAVGIILAGGQGRRMGGVDKGSLLLAGQPMIAHVIGRLAPQVGRLAINANGRPERFAAFERPVLADLQAGYLGPLAGMLAGLRWAEGLASAPSHAVFVPTDTPFLPRDLVSRLLAVAGAGIAMAESSGGSQQAAVAIPVRLADDLDRHLTAGGRLSILGWLERHGTTPVRFPDHPGCGVDPFMNINTPEDLAEAERIFDECL
jgi:molybdenum cofactor guanylyltransferase